MSVSQDPGESSGHHQTASGAMGAAALRAKLAETLGVPFADQLVRSFELSGTTLTAKIGQHTRLLAKDAERPAAFAGGKYMAWSTGDGVSLYSAASGKVHRVFGEVSVVEAFQACTLTNGRDLLVASVREGEVGERTVLVCHPEDGVVARIERAAIGKVKGDALNVKRYQNDDSPNACTGYESHDLKGLLAKGAGGPA